MDKVSRTEQAARGLGRVPSLHITLPVIKPISTQEQHWDTSGGHKDRDTAKTLHEDTPTLKHTTCLPYCLGKPTQMVQVHLCGR